MNDYFESVQSKRKITDDFIRGSYSNHLAQQKLQDIADIGEVVALELYK